MLCRRNLASNQDEGCKALRLHFKRVMATWPFCFALPLHKTLAIRIL